jgi:MFS family permease
MIAAVVLELFLLLLVGALLFGFATAANLQARYAATDLATPERRGRALALVVWATTVGAVAGPNLTSQAQRSPSGWSSTSSPGRSSSRSSPSCSAGCSSW